MNEKLVKETLDFLIEEYDLKYDYQQFENCPFGNWCMEAYSYYNDYGCFTITKLLARDDVEYVYLKNIALLKTYMYSRYSERLKYQINITSIEGDIWEKYKKRSIFRGRFWSDKKYLKILSEVIKVQIEQRGEFFGIKVKNND